MGAASRCDCWHHASGANGAGYHVRIGAFHAGGQHLGGGDGCRMDVEAEETKDCVRMYIFLSIALHSCDGVVCLPIPALACLCA